MAPAIGGPAPHSSICRPTPNENTSRPQSCACIIEGRKKPSVERGPKLSAETRLPQSRITSGVRQVINFEAVTADMGTSWARRLGASVLHRGNADKLLPQMDS